ncbi:hypothetical protein [Asticcacaulis sp. AND118]|uniref:hypothetical protein n=1 Tax=Asticcacaulis sp. AND118 TaxID=2840468 RepID=UPI001CFF8381|nr:hypothetical protein [Asticcacaulis sp. AND118]UDF02474.1 hypothetical protein LH365_08465 [Asticcacaulis sp. AND118]
MDHAQRTDEHLTPEQRRERLRAFADRMLIALEDLDTPQTRDDVTKGVRTALMIERLYARCDASETQAYKRAATSIEDQVTLKSKLKFKWSGYYFDKAPDVPFVTLKPSDLAGLQWPRPESDPMADLRVDLRANIDAYKSSGKSAHQPALEPQPEPVKASEPVQPRPEPAAPAKPQGKPLTPEQMALRDRVLNTEPIPLPKNIAWIDHDYGLIRDEDIEVIYGDGLGYMYDGGCTRKGILRTLQAFPREYLNEFWPDIFPLDTS